MDGPPAMALGVDPPQADVMERRPREPDARILPISRLAVLAFFGTIMAAGTLGLLAWGLTTRTETEAATMAFTAFVVFQFFHVLNARLERDSAFSAHSLSNRWLWAALAGVLP